MILGYRYGLGAIAIVCGILSLALGATGIGVPIDILVIIVGVLTVLIESIDP